MTQDDILRVLEVSPSKWFTVSELHALIKINRSSINRLVAKLHRTKEVYRRVSRHYPRYLQYEYRIRL